MLDYDDEADRYDEERGGLPRAREAAAAVLRLIPARAPAPVPAPVPAPAPVRAPAPALCVDLAGGTGIVAAELRAAGLRTVVVDLSLGMLRHAAARLPGQVIRARAESLPMGGESVEVVNATWLLHLVPDAAPIVAEAARVLRPGGVFVTTVDKQEAHGHPVVSPTDAAEHITELAIRSGLRPREGTTFVGRGQDRGDGCEPVYSVLSFGK